MPALRKKELLQKEDITVNRTVAWTVVFVFGIVMILGSVQISRYISDLNGVFTAGIILSIISGIGLLLELYGKRR